MPTSTIPVKKHFLATDRGLVHVQECGQGAPTTVAVLSLTSFGHVIVDRLLPALAERGHHALAFDLMGYGRSDRRDGTWCVEDFADNIEQAFAVRGIVPTALVCGHFSSWTGVEIASRQRAGLAALVLDGTPVFDAARRARQLAAAPVPPLAWDAEGSHAVEYWKRAYRIVGQLDPGSALGEEQRAPGRRFREACLAVVDSMAFEPGTAEAANRFEIERKLPRIEVPTLVSCGDYDWNLPHHAALVAALPQAVDQRWPGVHPLHDLAHPERAADYALLVDRFIRTHPLPARSQP